MEQLIKINQSEIGEVISARDLYEFLGFSFAQWKRWSEKNIVNDYFFTENIDYQAFNIELNGNKTTEYAISVDMAKELSMLARNEKGKIARQFFIAAEKERNLIKSSGTHIKEIPQSYAEALLEAGRLAMENEHLLLENTKMKPRSEFVDLVFSSDDLITMGQAAKLLNLSVGRNNLFKVLRDKGVLFKDTNEPKQGFIDRGYFKLKENKWRNGAGGEKISIQTLVTQKGLGYIAKITGAILVPQS